METDQPFHSYSTINYFSLCGVFYQSATHMHMALAEDALNRTKIFKNLGALKPVLRIPSWSPTQPDELESCGEDEHVPFGFLKDCCTFICAPPGLKYEIENSPGRQFSKKHLCHILKCCELKWKHWRITESKFRRPLDEFRHEPIFRGLGLCKENSYLWIVEYTMPYALDS